MARNGIAVIEYQMMKQINYTGMYYIRNVANFTDAAYPIRETDSFRQHRENDSTGNTIRAVGVQK